MQVVWISLKKKVDCMSKLSDVVSSLSDCSAKKPSWSSDKEELQKEALNQHPYPLRRLLFRPISQRVRFCELGAKDPTRNIIEKIFLRALSESSKLQRKIERVLRVENSDDVLKRFQRHREMVMKKANAQPRKHPRSVVDGNEMLLFYTTAITCRRTKKAKNRKVSEPCKNPTCRLCRIIQSKFDTEDTRRNGIQLSINSEETVGDALFFAKAKKNRKAVILCRTIAGRITDKAEGANEDWDSVGTEGLNSGLEYLTVRHPGAVLPCFIGVFT